MERTKFKAAIITMKETEIYRDIQLKSKIHSVIEKSGNKTSFDNILNQIGAYTELNAELIKALSNKPDNDGLLERLAEASIAILFIQEMFNISDATLKKAITIKIQDLR